ncbi:ImmA/IrrE family metallo-endopeptidase [Variovorax defluvii]|uniref:ImmA/IrrE family metallo-endopeptidase n=1 Tax=Variovorax defluvii TaxID=913761 RepID=A0ABP8IFB7_9BURK
MNGIDLTSAKDAGPSISARALGLRIKAARESRGMTQDSLTSDLGFADRQTLSAIEQGDRKVKPKELLRIAEVLDYDIEHFLDPFVVAGEAAFSWRANERVPAKTLDAFEERAGRLIGMLRFLRRCQPGSAPPFSLALRLTILSTYEEALASGEAVAQNLELGSPPAERLIDRIESALDIAVLYIDPSPSAEGEAGISGATCHLPDLGVILINRNESPARRHFDAAHELFHAMTWNAMRPERLDVSAQAARGKAKRIEQLADNFASGLLMPTVSLDKLIDARAFGDVAHLVEVADRLQVSPAALAWRLFNAKRIDETVRLRLCQAKSGLIDSPKPKRYSDSFVAQVHAGIEHGHVSARKVAKALGLTLPKLAELFEEHSKPLPFAM